MDNINNIEFANKSKILYVRYPSNPWCKFIPNTTNLHQLNLLEKFIKMNVDSYYFNNKDNSVGGSVSLLFNRCNISTSNDIDAVYLYNYITDQNKIDEDTTEQDNKVEFMYCEPGYAAYINRIIDY